MKIKSQRKFSNEFKRNAVQQSLDSPDAVKSVAISIGIAPQLLVKWRSQMTSKKHTVAPIPNKGPEKSLKELEREVVELKKRLADAELENDILKKATAYFERRRE